jgi:Fe-S cluster assembly protein SufD
VSEDELFYLQARGIPREAASRLIVNGFFNSLLEKLPDPVLREYLMGLVARRLQVS